jgi:hypothetical protein
MYDDILELAFEHAGYEYRKVLEYFWGCEGFKIHIEYEEDKLRAFLCYIPLSLDYDMICVTDRDNIFTKNTWRLLIKYVGSREKEIRIHSTIAHNPTIQKALAKYNGYAEGDTLIFVKE